MNGIADVSVVMPAFRAAGVIGRALASVANQSLKPREVIVVVDGSRDGTLEAVQAMVPRMNGIALRVLWQEHAGPGAARNRALRESSGQWIAFLDADDEWLPQKLERSMHFLSTGSVLVAHDGIIVDGERALENLCSRRFAASADPFVGLYRRGYIDTCSVVVRREAVFGARGFDPDLPVGQDFDLFLEILGKPGARFLVFPEALVRYHITPGSVTSRTFRRLFCQMRILRRHAPVLRGRKGVRVVHVWFRTLAVHYEAAQTFVRRKNWVRLAATLALLPLQVAAATTSLVFPPGRGSYLAESGETARPAKVSWLHLRAARLLWWGWVGGIALAYLAQFLDLAKSILAMVGLA